MKAAFKTNFADEIRATGVMEALEKSSNICSAHMAELHGSKMDGPRNYTESALVSITDACDRASYELRVFLDQLVPFRESDRYEYSLTPDSLVWDVGGFEGDFTREIHRRYGCKVVCFEPVFYRELEKNLAGLKPKVIVESFALGNSNRTEIWNVKWNSTGAFAGKDERGEVAVHIRDFDGFLGTAVDLLKLNVEGMEFELLEAIHQRGLIGRFSNIQIQFHDIAPNAKVRFDAIQAELAKTHHLTLYSGWQWQNWRRNE